MSAPMSGVRARLLAMLAEQDAEDAPATGSEQTLLDLAALPRDFDEALLREVLVPLATEGVAEDGTAARVVRALLEHPDVQRVPSSVGSENARSVDRYRLRTGARAERLARWTQSLERGGDRAARGARSATFLRASTALAEWCAGRGAEWALECLYHRIVSDPAGADRAIDDAFTEADARYDRVRCYELLAVLDERAALLTAGLAATHERLRRYYAARTLWAADYQQSTRVLERAFMRDAFDWLVAPSAEWLGVLEARGGMGKSMFVRWLIARRCVPTPHRIPCARVDFDFEPPRLLAEYPWLIVPRLAQQLEVQLPTPGAPTSVSELMRLAGEVDELGRTLSGARTSNIGAGFALTPEENQQRGLEVAERFGRALGERLEGADPRVLLVFDTIEEAWLQREFTSSDGRNVMEALLELLRVVHAVCPSLRVVLAGRFSPAGPDGGAEFAQRFAGEWRSIPVEPFDQGEAETYLTRNRGLPDATRVSAIVARSQGMPLVLALWADIVLSRPTITVDEIEASPDADLAYLVERVLDRLHDRRLQWVIRYGVVPRRLTRAVFEGVLLPRLAEAMRGQAPHDDPRRDGMPGGAREARFRTDLLGDGEPLDPTTLWDALGQYVSRASFVSRDGSDADAVKFHVEVVEPMRRVLARDQAVTYRLLHEDALRFFERLAREADDEAARADAMREAVHHLLQLGVAVLVPTVERWVIEASLRGDALVGRVLLEELEAAQRAAPGEPSVVLPAAVLRDAHGLRLEALERSVQEAPPHEAEARWMAFAHGTAAFRTFVGATALLPAPPALLRAEALVSLHFRGAAEAWPLFTIALQAADTRDDRLLALRGAIETAGRLGLRKEADALARDAWALVQAGDLGTLPAVLRLDLARLHRALGDLAAALALLDAAPDAHVIAQPRDLVRLELHAVTLLEAGEPERVIALLAPHVDAEDRLDASRSRFALVRLDALHADALTRAGRSDDAATHAFVHLNGTVALPLAKLADTTDRAVVHRAAADAGRAVAALAMETLDAGSALEAAERAQRDAAYAADAAGAARALAFRLELALVELGDLALADALLTEATQLTLPMDSEEAGWLRLLRHRHAMLRSPAAEAPTDPIVAVESLLDDAAIRRFRSLRVLALGLAVAGLRESGDARHVEHRDAWSAALAEELDAVHPVGARHMSLARLASWLGQPFDLGADARARLTTLIHASPRDRSREPVASVHLQRALAAWLIGDLEAARAWVQGVLALEPLHATTVRLLELAERLDMTDALSALLPALSDVLVNDEWSAETRARATLAICRGVLSAPEAAQARIAAPMAAIHLSTAVGLFEEIVPISRWHIVALRTLQGLALRQGQETAATALGDRALELEQKLGPVPDGALPGSSRPPTSAPSSSAHEHLVGTGSGTAPNAKGLRLAVDLTRPRRSIAMDWQDGLRIAQSSAEAVPDLRSVTPVDGDRLRALAPSRDRKVLSFELVKQAADAWSQLAEAVGAVVPEAAALAAELRTPGDCLLRLVPGSPALAALPIELLSIADSGGTALAGLGGGAYRTSSAEAPSFALWVQEALSRVGERTFADGVWGPLSQRSLVAFQEAQGLVSDGTLDRPTLHALTAESRRHGTGRPLALVARSTLPGTRGPVRSLGKASKRVLDASALYAELGFEVAEAGDDLARTLRARPPVVLHLRGAFDESASLGGLVMRLAPGEGSGGRDRVLTPSMLGRALRELPRVLRPMLVLDPPPERSPTEGVRQLLLRNVFAHELFQLEAAPAIVATGFEAPDDGSTPRSYQVFAEAWRHGFSVLEVLQRLHGELRRHRAPADLATLLAERPEAASIVYAATPAATLFVRPGAEETA